MENIVTASAAQLGCIADGVILDVRTGVEHKALSLVQSHLHVPLHELKAAAFLKGNAIPQGQPVYLLCRSGKRAELAAEALAEAGHNNCIVIEGGILACAEAGVGVKKGEVISLERQVRMAAGLLVILGVALGHFVTPWLYGLSAAVGVGLLFAGITDSCGLAFVLARAPWNKSASA